MKLKRACLKYLLMACLFSSQSVHAAGFAGTRGTICVVPERALVFYNKVLYVAEPGTCVITKFDNDESFAGIIGKLTPQIHLVKKLAASVAKGSRDIVAVRTRLTIDGADASYFLSPTEDGGHTLTKSASDEGALWRDDLVDAKGLPDDSHTYDYTLEHARLGRFIVVSSKETIIKDRDGKPLTLHALVLGEKKDAARFQIINISGP